MEGHNHLYDAIEEGVEHGNEAPEFTEADLLVAETSPSDVVKSEARRKIQEPAVDPSINPYLNPNLDADMGTTIKKSKHKKINAAWQASEPLHEIINHIDGLVELAYSPNEVIRERMKVLIPEYQKDSTASVKHTKNQVQRSIRTG